MIADIPGVGVLGEGMTGGIHPKHPDREVYIYSGLWFIRHFDRGRAVTQETVSIKS